MFIRLSFTQVQLLGYIDSFVAIFKNVSPLLRIP